MRGYAGVMMERDFREPDPFPGFDTEDEGEFASEHEATLVEQLGGGPEAEPEPESPSGLAGADE